MLEIVFLGLQISKNLCGWGDKPPTRLSHLQRDHILKPKHLASAPPLIYIYITTIVCKYCTKKEWPYCTIYECTIRIVGDFDFVFRSQRSCATFLLARKGMWCLGFHGAFDELSDTSIKSIWIPIVLGSCGLWSRPKRRFLKDILPALSWPMISTGILLFRISRSCTCW